MDRPIKLSILEKITNNFSALEKIGGGGYGDVYKGKYRGKTIAVKLLHRAKNIDDRQFMNELANHKKVQHPNIVKLVGYCNNMWKKHYEPEGPGGPVFGRQEHRVLCFEYMEGGSLEKRLSNDSLGNDWPTHYKIIKGICLGLCCLHRASVHHLDIKPANILLDKDMTPKIADFGLSRIFTGSRSDVILERAAGTPKYMAPELKGEHKMSKKTDIFSLGVTIIDIMAGPLMYHNFSDMDTTEFTNEVLQYWTERNMTSYLFEVKRCIEIAIECVCTDKNKRPTIEKVIRDLNNMEADSPSRPLEDTNTQVEEVPKAKKRKIIESASGQGKNKLGSSDNADITSMDNISSMRGKCTAHRWECNFHTLQSFSRNYPTNMLYLVGEKVRAVDSARGAMGSLLDKLGKLVMEGYNLEFTMKNDIESFSLVLKNIHLDLLKLENIGGSKIWVDEVRELSYEIEDMVDRFLVHVKPKSIGNDNFKELKNEGLNLLVGGIPTHHQIDYVISSIKEKVQDMAHKTDNYKFDLSFLEANATNNTAIDPRILINYIDRESLVGIESPKKKITSLLEEGEDRSKLKIVAIVGMGGLGKTTIAEAVYDELIEYDHKAFVQLGRNPNVNVVLNDIISELYKGFKEANLDWTKLLKELKKLLQNKRYFIVIDDAWDTREWNVMRRAFPENKNGSRVLITTRNHQVALACCNYEARYVYAIEGLSDEDSRRLLFRRIFGAESDCPVTARKKEISVDILKKCGGMPLAINSIASLLAGKPETIWENIWQSLGALTTLMKGNTQGKKYSL